MPLITALPLIIQRCNPTFPINGIQVECATIADVVRIYAEKLHIILRPLPKKGFYLSFTDDPGRRVSMDIRVNRDGKVLRMKGDTRFALLPNDRVELVFRIG